MRVLLLLLFSVYCLQGCYGAEDKSVQRGSSTVLQCPIDSTNCGDLHSIKWFKGSERIGVTSGDGEYSQVEGPFKDKLSIDFTKGKSCRLIMKSITIEDEDTYSCEVTYLEPLETCETTGEYQTNLKVVVPPSAIIMMDKEGNEIKNGSRIGPLNEGHRMEMTCIVKEARPKPTVGWYRGGKKLAMSEETEENDDVFSVTAKLILILRREVLGQNIECRVETTPENAIISNQLSIDLQVRPTKIHLSGVKSHVVEGSKVLLQCHVYGGRPAANIYWYNSTKLIDEDNHLTTISTKESPQNDGTFETISQVIFTATRFENLAVFQCEADNVVMRDEKERPMKETLNLEVMYPPVVTVKPDNLTINETGEFLLFCEYDANPATLTSVRWMHNKSVLNLNQSRFEGGSPEHPAMLVKNATRDDKGEYTCELANIVGTATSDNRVIVDVQYKPTVAIRFEPTSPIIENDHVNVTLHCDVIEGNPHKLLKVEWMIDGLSLTVLPECNEDSFEDSSIRYDDDDEEKSQKSQNYFCFIDPTKILLQNVNREFLGNYSCRGENSAGWGEESNRMLLDVYYEPGNASISVTPVIPNYLQSNLQSNTPNLPIKKGSMILSCAVEDLGNPKSTRFHWLRGDEPVKDIVTSTWTIDPVGLHSRNNFSCYAFNDGGNGTWATINIDVLVPPTFISKLPPYSGFLYSEPNVMLSCRVECVPECSMKWYRDKEEITNANGRYFIKNTALPADMSTGDFESILSELHFNITAWPEQHLDSLKDSANYTCKSSSNSVGKFVESVTSFGVEYPPENVTIKPAEVHVVEGKAPPRLSCSASAHPTPKYQWKHLDTNEVLMTSSALEFPRGLNRTDKGVYSCIVENKHGSNFANITMNILYAPNCTITRSEVDDEDALICVADGNPDDYKYEWDFKSENETDAEKNFEPTIRNKRSYLILGDVPQKRTYICRANNTVGPGSYCEITVEGHLMWYQKLWPLTPLIIVAILVGCLIAVIILICIIICMCRRRRKRSGKSMEKSLVDNKPNDPNAEPCENYENLPFHGLQNPPTKSLKATDFDEFDGVYADLDEETYGPIKYKQASIYQYMKFKGGNQK